MYYFDAVNEILNKASRVRLPGDRFNVVVMARRAFDRRGSCDAKFIDPIEKTPRVCLRSWTPEQRRKIWESTGAGSSANFEDYDLSSIELDLEGELLNELIEELAGSDRRQRMGDPDD